MVSRRNFIKMAGVAAALTVFPGCGSDAAKSKGEKGNDKMKDKVAGADGDKYVPYDKREGKESVVFFTRDLSAAGLLKIFDRVKENLSGKVAIKLHTGEPHGPNIIPRPWVKELIEKKLPNSAIVESNTYYKGARFTTEDHRKTLETNGWTFAKVDIIDETGTAKLPVKNGKWFTEMSVGKSLPNYDSFLALTHFKGHTMGGFGGSDKNIGIGCADGRDGKKWIHSHEGEGQWSVDKEELMERISESTKSVVDHFKDKIAFINVMRNMSVSCDCEGTGAQPVVTPDVGIVASLDILATDQASVDLIYALPEESRHDFVERMETRHGLRQLSYMKELGMGNDKYKLIDIDNGDKVITAKEAVAGINGKWASDGQ
ncbi:MAG: DUF362 domain-containing protein [Selenomonadaceae bacterium]|nr:DUF362 domain-containing protein [Selenomonadaceae bacterium]